MATTGKFNLKLFIVLIVIVFIAHIIFLRIILKGNFSGAEQNIPVDNPTEIDFSIEPEIIE